MSNLLISVIIPTYNSASVLSEAIESAIAQTYRPLEIIVVDDGSKDDTSAVVSKYGDQVHYIHQQNTGPAGARNRGILASRGELLAFLDADDQWLPEKLSKQYATIAEEGDIALIHSDVFYWRSDTGEKYLQELGRNVYAGNCYAELLTQNRIINSSVLMRKRCIDQIGYFDDKLFGTEDWDLWIRIARHFRFAYLNEALVAYRIHPNNISGNSLRMRENELLVIEKYLMDDSNARGTFPKGVMEKRLFDLCFGISFHYMEKERFVARRYLRKAIQQRPLEIGAITRWLATYVPVRLMSMIKQIKSGFVGAV
jgi:glycosyltransferase involved in cell wall biosynthesis